MATVAQVLKSKPNHPVFTIDQNASVYDAIAMMVGIMTERDYARKVVLMDRVSRLTPVRDIMSSQVRFVSPNQTTDECMALMTDHRMRHLPVLDGESLVGMISIGDLVANIISEQKLTIQHLEGYIRGETM
jgi:CBS domain-containing protein